ncbi:MAG TPA: metal ABC transporter permease, partial [Acidobacteriota bacterium]|nr:metal ABC transporter permease [Acidobacteriota bacterium]
LILVLMVGFILKYYKQLFFMTFNDELARLRHKEYSLVNFLFTIMVALAVVVSIRAVGILLVSALLVLPTLISLQISRSFKSTIVVSILCSVFAMICGIFLSFVLDLPPSGMIVMILLLIFAVFSLKPITALLKK